MSRARKPVTWLERRSGREQPGPEINGPLPASLSISTILACCRDSLAELVAVEAYEFASCYLWYERPLYNDFGEEIRRLPGDTIYLYRDSSDPLRDLFHELGHVIGRRCQRVGNVENGYRGCWDSVNEKLIAEIGAQRHWSHYLNRFAETHDDFQANAASETWAELFMLWHLYPHSAEAGLLGNAMTELQEEPAYQPVRRLVRCLDLPENYPPPRGTDSAAD